MRRLFMPGYYSGFSNNLMSLEIAVVLAYLTDRVLVPYRFRLPRRFPMNPSAGGVPEPMLVPDLFDIPVPWSNEYLLKTWISLPGAVECARAPVYESVFCYSLDERQGEAADLHISTQALGFYSYFFYLDEGRRRAVVDLMRRFLPKRPYLEAADRVTASLGRFNAIHVRRDDFLSNELSKRKITRSTSVSGEEIVSNLASRMSRDDPLVICTDGSSREEIFGPIQKYFHEAIFLDRYLREDAGMRGAIARLPRYDEHVQALLTQLVASRARVFAGTLFSTFTALIQRKRGFANEESPFLYCHNDFLSPLVRFDRCEFLPVDDGPYSWNRIRYPVSPDAYSWFREWPESFRMAPPAAERSLAVDDAV